MLAMGREPVKMLGRVVDLVKAPEEAEPVIGIVSQPVGSVHGRHRERDYQPARPVRGRPQLDPPRVATDQRGCPDAEQRHQRNNHAGMQGHEAGILQVTSGEQRAALRWPDSLANAGGDDKRDQERRGQLRPPCPEHHLQAGLPEQLGGPGPDDDARYSG